jgi:hypothetical protein
MGSVAEIIDRIREVKKRSEERFFIACSSVRSMYSNMMPRLFGDRNLRTLATFIGIQR